MCVCQQGSRSLGVLGERGSDRNLGRQEEVGGTARGGGSGASDRDTGLEDSSNDADSEASESESSSRLPGGTVASPASLKVQQGGAVHQLVSAVSRLGLGPACGEPPPSHLRGEEQQSPGGALERHHQGAFQALSHSYTPYSKECSIQSCLHQFTSVELLMGNNKLLCENCTEMRRRQLRRSPTGRGRSSPSTAVQLTKRAFSSKSDIWVVF